MITKRILSSIATAAIIASTAVCAQSAVRFDISVAEVWAKQQTNIQSLDINETYGVQSRMSYPEIRLSAMTPYLTFRGYFIPKQTLTGQSSMKIENDDLPITSDFSISSSRLEIGYPTTTGQLVFEPQLVLLQKDLSLHRYGQSGKHTINQYQPFSMSGIGFGINAIQNMTNGLVMFNMAINRHIKTYDIWIIHAYSKYYGGLGYTHKSIKNDVINTTIDGGSIMIGVMF